VICTGIIFIVYQKHSGHTDSSSTPVWKSKRPLGDYFEILGSIPAVEPVLVFWKSWCVYKFSFVHISNFKY
jgi:hypothetical protein